VGDIGVLLGARSSPTREFVFGRWPISDGCSMTPKSEDLADFFRTWNIEFGRCLEPMMQCGQPAIRAHSIQNRQTITLLEQDNHVIVWQPRFSKTGPDIALRRIGRNEASTFAGFCNQHDTELFRPLDTKPLDSGNGEQLFLLAYRGITCELHAIITAAVQAERLYKARVERGADSPDSSSPAGKKAVEQMLLSWATWRYRHRYYDEPLLRRSFDGVEHDVIDLSDQAPCLAASSFITLKDVPVTEDLVGVAINILPVSETRTIAAFSYAKKDQGIVRAALDRILGSTGDVQKYELSKLVLSRISNVLISPRHFDQWVAERAKKIADAFLRTVESQQDVGEDADFMLF
jgi:hypothetical protein